VADVHHPGQESLVVDLVEDTILTDTNPPSIPPAELFDSMGSGLIGKAPDIRSRS
jgi:hypothetical protein